MPTHAHLTQQIADKNLAGHVHRLSRQLAQLAEHRWAADGHPAVRSGHVQLLRHLDAAGTRATVLAQRAQVTKQTMSRLVQELAASGYVALAPDPADRRAQLVRLSPRGEAFLVYLATTLQDLEAALGQVLGAARLAEFSATLRELNCFAEARWQQLPG